MNFLILIRIAHILAADRFAFYVGSMWAGLFTMLNVCTYLHQEIETRREVASAGFDYLNQVSLIGRANSIRMLTPIHIYIIGFPRFMESDRIVYILEKTYNTFSLSIDNLDWCNEI